MIKYNKEAWGMDYTQRIYCKDKNEKRSLNAHVQKMSQGK
jgi:hypothetical protein